MAELHRVGLDWGLDDDTLWWAFDMGGLINETAETQMGGRGKNSLRARAPWRAGPLVSRGRAVRRETQSTALVSLPACRP